MYEILCKLFRSIVLIISYFFINDLKVMIYVSVGFILLGLFVNVKQIKKKDLKPGDIGVLNDASKHNHIGIYAGDGKWFENSVVFGVQLTNFSQFKYFFRIKNIE